MKHKIILLIILCIALMFSISVYAHSGKTDEYYGHFDHSTAEYHYHHGYPAHQHDGGNCPYDTGSFDVVEYSRRREIDNAWKEIESEWNKLYEYEERLIEEDRRISEERLQLETDTDRLNSLPSKVFRFITNVLMYLLPAALVLAIASPLMIWLIGTIKTTAEAIIEKFKKQ